MLSDSKLLAERFWSKVDRSGGSDGCWVWTRARNTWGYGAVRWGGKNHGAHRVAYELTHGPIPHGATYHGTCVLHRCDNPPCCNPGHLFLGTQTDNMADKRAKGRQHHGSGTGNAKLTDEKVRVLRLLRGLGATYRSLGDMYGVSHSVAREACLGITWAHVW